MTYLTFNNISLYSLQEDCTFLEGLQALLQLFLFGLVWGSSQHIGLQFLDLKFQVSLLVSKTLKEVKMENSESAVLPGQKSSFLSIYQVLCQILFP